MLKKIQDWFNGNKTAIGALLLALAGSGLIADHTVVYDALLWVGGILGGGGVLHKLAKGVNNT